MGSRDRGTRRPDRFEFDRGLCGHAREPVRSFYCSDIASVTGWLGGVLRETSRFANVQLQETQDRLVYFDQREQLIASPIQVYL